MNKDCSLSSDVSISLRFDMDQDLILSFIAQINVKNKHVL